MGLELFRELYLPPCCTIYIFARRSSISFELHAVELVGPRDSQLPCKMEEGLPEHGNGHLLLGARELSKGDFVQYPPTRSKRESSTRVDKYLEWQYGAIQLPATNVYLLSCSTSQGGLWTGTLAGEVGPGSPYGQALLATEQLSLADLVALTELMQLTTISCHIFQDWPRLAI
ncbi:glutathione S-transferase theta-3-like [Trichechus manatus latirostris]|uniref:Glutathione S-transferase theta-3-like n=1 Tax=Trichechus manatus latirostris TaxID=127582 RepID=A0A2Y9E3G9_TRIMA|nr:glutathione S-transferase theta-3-like [Trichechus manatus latirostris]